MPSQLRGIPLRTKVLGVFATPDLARLMPLFLLLFRLIFKASKVEVARSNRAGQAKFHTGSYKSRLVNGDLLSQS
jgi:hypothetical protein